MRILCEATQPLAHSKQLTCAGPHKNPALHRATKSRSYGNRAAIDQSVLAPTRAQHYIQPQGTKQLQAHSKQPPCAGEHKSPARHETTKARNSCKRAAGNQHVQHVLTHTRAQRFIKPYRLQAHSNNPTGTHHMAVHRNPALQARDSLQAHAKRPTCASPHMGPALHQATKARHSCKHTTSNQYVLARTPEPSTPSSHNCLNQIQVYGKQPTCAGPYKSPAPHQTATAMSHGKRTSSIQHMLALTRTPVHQATTVVDSCRYSSGTAPKLQSPSNPLS